MTLYKVSELLCSAGVEPALVSNMEKEHAGEIEAKRESDGGSNKIQLQKQLGLMNGVGIIVGIIVGSGIFVSPKGVLLEAGSVGLCLMVWGLTGVICGVGALCYAELGTCILTSGADYGYILQAYGDLPAFLFLWVCLVVLVPTGNAITALTFANYVLQPLVGDCGPPQAAVTLLAALCISKSLNVEIKYRSMIISLPSGLRCHMGAAVI